MLIDEYDAMPSSQAYRNRFGSLIRAYRLVGFSPTRDYHYVAINRAIRQLHPAVLSRTIQAIRDVGGAVRHDKQTDLLIVNDEVTVSIVISRCSTQPSGRHRWHVRLESGLRPDISVVVRMDAVNEAEQDYYILPTIDIEAGVLKLSEENGTWLDAYRADTLAPFFQLAARTPLSEVA
jgi:hypothetical protein